MKIAIANAGWMPERKATTERLLSQVTSTNTKVFTSERREHASIWARRIWEWCARQDDHVVVLNDDVMLHPQFTPIVRAIVQAVPDEIISLHTQAPLAPQYAAKGHHWIRCYWLTGPAYILPPGAARALLDWDAPWDFLSRVNEDNVAIHWAWENQRPIYSTIPAIAHHDTDTKSTLGYEGHPFRTPSVPWTHFTPQGADLTDPAFWQVQDPPWVPNPWMTPPGLDLLRRILKAGHKMCFMCVEHEGIVGRERGGPMLCRNCLINCANTVNKAQASDVGAPL